jgi:hypothetical protein
MKPATDDRPSRRDARQGNLKPFTLNPIRIQIVQWGALFFAALLLLFIPEVTANQTYISVTQEVGYLIASGLAVIGIGLMLVPSRIGWAVYFADWLGAGLLTSGLSLAVAEWTGAAPASTTLDLTGLMFFIGRVEARWFWPLFKSIEGGKAEPPAVTFRDDGEQIILYPNRVRIAGRAAIMVGLALILFALAYFLRSFGLFVIGCCAVLAVICLLPIIPSLPRLLWRWPVLIITSEGITDLASATITGLGLIPWSEIESVADVGQKPGGLFGETELEITPVSRSRLLCKRSLFRRLFLEIYSILTLSFTSSVCISSLYLAETPAEIAARVAGFV